jgi:hypothetical protein
VFKAGRPFQALSKGDCKGLKGEAAQHSSAVLTNIKSKQNNLKFFKVILPASFYNLFRPLNLDSFLVSGA